MRNRTSTMRVPQHPAKTAQATLKTQRLRVVPDEAVPSYEAQRSRNSATREQQSVTIQNGHLTPLSLEEIVTCLQLFSLAECEDGELLLRLLGEVHRFVFGNLRATTGAVASHQSEKGTHVTLRQAKVPFPALLLILSELGISEEQVLQAIICRPRNGGRRGDEGLLYGQLRQYTAAELVALCVALHRFGLHQDYAFQQTMNTLLRHHLHRRRSDAAGFTAFMEKLAGSPTVSARSPSGDRRRTGSASANAPLTHEDLSAEEQERLLVAAGRPETVPSSLGEDKDTSAAQTRSVFDDIPAQLPDSLACPTSLLLEALTAISLSLFRRKAVVTFYAYLLVASAVGDVSRVAESPGLTPTERRDAVNAVSHQILRGVRLCEEMQEPQPLLAECLSFTIDVARLGVVADGGEDTDDIPSERRAYYDHVTADLVKVNRSL